MNPLSWKLLSNKFKKMPTLGKDEADCGPLSNDAKLSVNEDEEDIIDSQLTVKTDNTSKSNEDDADNFIDDQATEKNDNVFNVNGDEKAQGLVESCKTVDGQKETQDVNVDLLKDGAPDDNIDKESVANDCNDEEDERSPRYETAREESNDSFPTSSQMLTPLEPLVSQPNSSAASSPLLTTQMSQSHKQSQQREDPLLHTQFSAKSTANSLLATQMTSSSPSSKQGSTEGTKKQMTQEEQVLFNTQGTTTSELQLGTTQTQETNSIKKSSQLESDQCSQNEKPPALFEDAADEDFIEKFASNMNDKAKDESLAQQDEGGVEDEQHGNGQDKEKVDENVGSDEEEIVGVEEENVVCKTGLLFEANESEEENDDDDNGVGLLTQAVNDDDESMSDMNSVKTQESEGDKSMSGDGDDKSDNGEVVDIIPKSVIAKKQDVVINLQNGIGEKDSNLSLSGLTGPTQSQSQSFVPAKEKVGSPQRSKTNSKHVSFQQDKMDCGEKSSQLDLDGTEKPEGEDRGSDEGDTKGGDTNKVGATVDTKVCEPEFDTEAEEKEKTCTILNKNDMNENDGITSANAEDKEASEAEKSSIAVPPTNINDDEPKQVLPSSELQGAESVSKRTVEDEFMRDDEMSETGTGDTIVPSGSAGWSLYDGETQPLLSGPSQMLTAPSTSQKEHDVLPNGEDDEEMNEDGSVVANGSVNDNIDDAEMKSDEAENEDEYNQNVMTQPLQKPESPHDDNSSKIKKVDDIKNQTEDKLVEMKHTQENGLSSALSYPEDHIEKNQGKVFDHESQTQQSQDLLALTPVKDTHSNNSSVGQKDNVVVAEKTTDSKLLVKTKPPSDKTSKKATSPKKLESQWISSTRGQANPDSSRLLLPTSKATEDPKLNEDEASDEESWVGHGIQENRPEDDIENTQDDRLQQQKLSSIKRLSAKRPRSPSNDSSTTEEEEELEEKMDPKVLRFGETTKRSYPTDTQSQASETEFIDEDNYEEEDDDDYESEVGYTTFPQSQTDEAIKRQLEDIQKMNLPSTRQLKEIASRRHSLDQIDEMRKQHDKEMKALKRENSKLRNAVNERDDIIEERDYQLAQKNKLLKSQAAIIDMMKKKLEIVSTAAGNFPASNVKSAPTKKPTPVSNVGKSKKKKRKREEKMSSSDSEDDSMPLSALKRNVAKKPRSSEADSHQPTLPVQKVPPKKATKAKDPPVKVKSLSAKKMTPRPLLSNDLSKHWKELEEKGWSYKTGPEPYNKVYVPKDGATHMGCQLGIHFFEADQVIAEAIKRGDLKLGEPTRLVNDNKTPKTSNQSEQQGDVALDDKALHGLVTLETARVTIGLVQTFLHAQNTGESLSSFRGQLFDPLWQRLKDQGAETNNGWRYERNSSPLALYSWCWVPPTSSMGNKGKIGEDYYNREEHLVLAVLNSVNGLKEVSMSASSKKEFDALIRTLTNAVEKEMSYEDARDGKDPNVRSRRARVRGSPVKPETKSSRKKSPRGQTASIAEAALTSSKKKSINAKKTPDKKRRTVSPNSGSGKKQKAEEAEEHVTPSFHMDQTQTQVQAPTTYERRSPTSSAGPLYGYIFLCSGVDQSVTTRIKKLGGELAKFETLTHRNAHRKLFFLSDHQCWRKPKYIMAAALGAPILHVKWLSEIEEKYKEDGEVSVFDSSLYTGYRLPTGLDLFKKSYTLQRASHARDWVRPGGRNGGIFEGMTIALALGVEAKTWKMILGACGATVRELSDIRAGKGKVQVDCCLFNAASDLPPHEISLPLHVTKLIEYIETATTPLLDLAWAHQSIIQRRRVPMDDERYTVNLKDNMCNLCKVNSIKRKNGGRFEKGDIIQFTCGKIISYGRIINMMLERQTKKCKLEIQLLEGGEGHDLIDCESNPIMTVQEASVQGQIVLLGARDFFKLGYLPQNSAQCNIFNQVSEAHASQM